MDVGQRQNMFFKPTEDWPPIKHSNHLRQEIFPAHSFGGAPGYEFTTPPFEIAVKELPALQDPTNPTQRQITATLELTHAVEPGELDRHLQLLMLGESAIFSA